MPNLKVLAFDVFGTVVDWHSSIVQEVEALCPGINGNEFAMAWRAGYKPAMQQVASGALGWTTVDELHHRILAKLLNTFGITYLAPDQIHQLNRVWHRLTPWPDSVAGLTRLKNKFIISTLSNGNIGLLTNMAKHAGLPWDCILSAEIFKKYKPAPEVYLGAARLFDVEPEQMMMVAAHQDDLAAARACGLKTAYIERPFEFGRAQPKDVSANSLNDFHATSLVELAGMLAIN